MIHAALSAILLAASPATDDARARLEEGDARGAMIRAEQAVRADPRAFPCSYR